MLLETERLIIREYLPEDMASLLPILSDPVTMRFWPRPFTEEEVRGWMERTMASYKTFRFGRAPLLLKETGGIIGDCGIMRSRVAGEEVYDLGYILYRDYWGEGFATEAASALRDYGFGSLGLEALHANMAHDNVPSQRVAERIGMERIGEFLNERNRGIRTFLYVQRNPASASSSSHSGGS